MTQNALYKKTFTRNALTTLFDEKVVHSSAVGRDGIRRDRFYEQLQNEISIILDKVEREVYKFTGFKQKLISKGAGKPPRVISISTFRDRLVLRALCEILSAEFSDAKMSPPHEFIKEIKELALSLGSEYSFLRVDIKNYYPSICQSVLMEQVKGRIFTGQLTTLLEEAITCPTGMKNSPENKNKNGVPQGLSVSNILASVYLLSIDEKYSGGGGAHYFRYVDDILILCKTSECESWYNQLKVDLKQLGLQCHDIEDDNPEKTKTSLLSEGISYLGYSLNDRGVSVRPSSYKRMFSNISRVFTSYKYNQKKEQFFWRLNLKITGCAFEGKRLGWMYFFSQTDDKKQLARLDFFVASQLKKYNLSEYIGQVKTFIKTYHEIRFNSATSEYVPDFAKYTYEEKVELIGLLMGKGIAEIYTWDVETVNEKFRKLTAREIAQLEKDLLEVFS